MVEERKGKNNLEVCIKTNKHSTKTRWTNLLKFILDCPALFDACKSMPKESKCDGTRFAGSFTTELKLLIEHPLEQIDKRYC